MDPFRKHSKQRNLCVLGATMVGKTSICTRFISDRFHDTYEPTYETSITHNYVYQGQEYELGIKDTQGLSDSDFRNEYCLGYHGYILVYSVASRRSLELLEGMNTKLLNLTGSNNLPRVVVGSKSDKERQVSVAEGRALALRWGCRFVECSAKFNHNTGVVFNSILDEINRVYDDPFSVNRSWESTRDSVTDWLTEPHTSGRTWGGTIVGLSMLITLVFGLFELCLGGYIMLHGPVVEGDNRVLSYVLVAIGTATTLASWVGFCALRLRNQYFMCVYAGALSLVVIVEIVLRSVISSDAMPLPTALLVVCIVSLVFQIMSVSSACIYQRLIEKYNDWHVKDLYDEL